jgi:glutamate--cysteine ligase
MTAQETHLENGVLELVSSSKAAPCNPFIGRGIEKEGLRVTPELDITQSAHPKKLGHALTHPRITTDYSEALLELITPVEDSKESLLATLRETHKYVLKNMGDECLWSGSMPCRLNGNDSIRIAEYGDSNIGKLKHVYRKGLDVRYGRIMQSIAGLHFNFSLSDTFWEALKTNENNDQSLQDYKSSKYFALTRNFRRYSWLLMYLFGASPALDKSFLDDQKHDLEVFDDKGTLFKPYATSLRMSDLGYHNNAQSSLNICFNTLSNFTTTLGDAVVTSYPKYEKIGIRKGDEYLQINTNILQIENEYYSSIRPKRTAHSGEKPTQALNERGVEYVEVRCLDLNPFNPLGIDANQVAFLDCFLLFCLNEPSPFLSAKDCQCVERNFNLVTNEGRKPNLGLTGPNGAITLADWGQEILGSISKFAQALDKQSDQQAYTQALQVQIDKLNNVELTPSALVLASMRDDKRSWLELCGALSLQHKTVLSDEVLTDSATQLYTDLAETSFKTAQTIKDSDNVDFDTYLEEYSKS